MADWTYYEWYDGPDFERVGGLLRSNAREVQRYDPTTDDWLTVPGDSLLASLALGDPTTVEISASEAEARRAELSAGGTSPS